MHAHMFDYDAAVLVSGVLNLTVALAEELASSLFSQLTNNVH
jgi:hypothetical protein